MSMELTFIFVSRHTYMEILCLNFIFVEQNGMYNQLAFIQHLKPSFFGFHEDFFLNLPMVPSESLYNI